MSKANAPDDAQPSRPKLTKKEAYKAAKIKGNKLARDLAQKKAKCKCVEPKPGAIQHIDDNPLYRIGYSRGLTRGLRDGNTTVLLDAIGAFVCGVLLGAASIIVALQSGLIS